MSGIVMKATSSLRPHPEHERVYGPVKQHDKYGQYRKRMREPGFDPNNPLLITYDDRIIGGRTRHAAAKDEGIAECPCRVFESKEEWEILQQIPLDNDYRNKNRLQIAREQQLLVRIEKEHGRQRMGEGGDGGPSKSTERVGLGFKRSGDTVRRNVRIVNAIDKAIDNGDHKKAGKLTELLLANKVTQALALIAGKKKRKAARQAQQQASVLTHGKKAHSEFFEACVKANLPADLTMLETELARMRKELEHARGRVMAQQPAPKTPGDKPAPKTPGDKPAPKTPGDKPAPKKLRTFAEVMEEERRQKPD
jgi:hypothetical protein